MRFALLAGLLVWSTAAHAQDFVPAPLVPPPPKAPKKSAADDDFMPTLLPAGPAKPAKKRPARTTRPKAAKRRPSAPVPAKVVITGPTEPLKAEQRADLTIAVTDAAGEPISVTLRISSDFGLVTPPLELDPGEYRTTYIAPAKLPEGGAAIVKVVVAEPKVAKPPSAQLMLTFEAEPPPALAERPPAGMKVIDLTTASDQPGRPARVVFAEERVDIRPGQSVTVRFKIEDENGREVPGHDVKLRSPTGTFSEIREKDGMYVAKYSPDDDQRGEVRLFAEVGGESLVGESVVVIEKPGLVPEQRRIGVDLTGYAGGLTNFGKMMTPSFELAADYQITSSFRIGVLGGLSPTSAEVASGKRGEAVPANPRQAEIGMKIIPVLARLTYLRPVGPIDLFAGAAAGAAFVDGTVTTANSQKEFSDIAPHFAGFAGIGLPLGPGVALLEVRMSHASVSFSDETTTVTGNVGGLSGALGYRLEL